METAGAKTSVGFSQGCISQKYLQSPHRASNVDHVIFHLLIAAFITHEGKPLKPTLVQGTPVAQPLRVILVPVMEPVFISPSWGGGSQQFICFTSLFILNAKSFAPKRSLGQKRKSYLYILEEITILKASLPNLIPASCNHLSDPCINELIFFFFYSTYN